MWYTILITLVVDVGGLLLLYTLLRDRVRRATTAEAQIAEIREEVSRFLVELNQTTDRNILLMEDRIASLNELLATADKKIGLLQREIEKHDVGTRIYSRLAQARPPAGPGSSRPAERPVASEATVRTEAPAALQETTAAPAPLAVELSERPEQSPRPRGSQRGPDGDLQQRVMMLHRAGFSTALIAGRVGVPLGEVELIISLEQRKGRA